MLIERIIEVVRASKLVTTIVPTLDSELMKSLRDCDSVLDLGCGPKSPIRNITWMARRVGVEAFHPYVETARLNQTHDEIREASIMGLDIEENSFDAVTLIDVIEHMTREDAQATIAFAKRIARKKVVINSPNGFIAQEALDGNDLQKHLSGWDLSDMKSLNFGVRGLAGLKFLRREVDNGSMGDDLLTTIRFRPRFFWFIVSTLSQPITYLFPRFAFSLFSVYQKRSR
jgi:SAM-dependent methyltransferase